MWFTPPPPPGAGPKFLSDDEQTQVGDLNWRQSHATHDLYHTIEAGQYPEWELSVQVGGKAFPPGISRLG